MASTEEFPCHLDINIPFPSARHAAIALRSLSVDKELSPLVKRHFAARPPTPPSASSATYDPPASVELAGRSAETVLEVTYSATTPRMLRVAVNGFFESLGVVLGVMEELEDDVLGLPGKESVSGAQGIEALAGEG